MENNGVVKTQQSGIWKMLGTALKYSAYLMIAIECLNLFVTKAQELENQQ